MSERSWLDRVAPVKDGVTKAQAWATLGLAAAFIAAGLIAWFVLPDGESIRYHLSGRVIGPVIILIGGWFVLAAVNSFRRSR